VEQSGARHNWTAGFTIIKRQFNGTETDAHRGFFGFNNDFGRTGIENPLLVIHLSTLLPSVMYTAVFGVDA
jgi:hypothetical protein